MKGFRWKYWVVPVAASVVLALVVHNGWLGKAEQKAVATPAVTVTTAAAGYVKKVPQLLLTGSIEGQTSVVVSAKIAGRIAAVAVEDGSAVEPGQELVRLESVELGNAVRQSSAAVARAEANYDNAAANYNRYLTLYQQTAISKQQLDSYETSLKIAQSDLGSARAAFSSAQEQYAYAAVSAPVTGLVANKTATIGQVVAAGQQLMTVESIDQVYAVVNIEQKDMGLVKTGMNADVTVDAFPGESFHGTIVMMNPTAGTNSRVFRTKIQLSNAAHKLKPGMFVKAAVVTGAEQPVLVVPQQALYQKQGLYYVFVLENGKAVRRQVEVGRMLDEAMEIRSGLREGDRVITSNINTIKDGDAVQTAS